MADDDAQMVKLKTRDGEIIEVSRADACRCVTICNMLEDAGGDDDVPLVPLPLVDARALRLGPMLAASGLLDVEVRFDAADDGRPDEDGFHIGMVHVAAELKAAL